MNSKKMMDVNMMREQKVRKLFKQIKPNGLNKYQKFSASNLTGLIIKIMNL